MASYSTCLNFLLTSSMFLSRRSLMISLCCWNLWFLLAILSATSLMSLSCE